MASPGEVLNVIWTTLDEMTDGVTTAVVQEGGAIAAVIHKDNSLDLNLIFQPLDESDFEEYKKALADAGIAFYFAPNALSDDEELELKAIWVGTEDALKKALEKVNAHLEATGGINITGKDLLGGGDE